MIKEEELLNRIRPILSEILGDNLCIQLSTNFEEINIESIKFVMLVVKCEEIFGIEVDDSNLIINKYITIGDYIKMLLCYIEKPENNIMAV